VGVAAAQQRMQELHARAFAALEPFGERGESLRRLSDWLLARRS